VGPDAEAGSSLSFDPSRRTLTLTRDPFGLHGLYTTEIGDVLWCASDARLLRRLPGVSHEVEPHALHGYLCFSYVPAPLTLTPGLRALPAGVRVVVTPGKTHSETTAAWQEGPRLAMGEDQAVAELRERLRIAVRRRLGNEREVAVFLSGGLDSSLIAALLVAEGVKLHLFTLDFGPPYDAELPYARQVAERLGRPLHRVPARPRQVRAALAATAAAMEQPFGDGVTVPLYLLGQAAAGSAGVVFNGEGGDQLFGGWVNKPLVAAELYGTGAYDREAAYLRSFHRFYGMTDSLYTSRARAAVGAPDVGAWIRPALNADGFTSLLHRLRAANLWLKGAQNIAPRCVQLAAAHGLQVRAPFLDRALTEWSFTLPPEWFLQGACEKHLLKRAAEPYLPSEVIWRPKRGMGAPVTEWCLGPLRREVARRLSPRRLKQDGWFEPAAIAALRRGEDHPGEIRRRRVGEKLWALLILHVWREA
jgi:asparagine synthase (glutamine-hydrolysing)